MDERVSEDRTPVPSVSVGLMFALAVVLFEKRPKRLDRWLEVLEDKELQSKVIRLRASDNDAEWRVMFTQAATVGRDMAEMIRPALKRKD